MLIRIPNVLTPAQVDAGRKMLEAADWTDGKATPGPLTKSSKNNIQVPSGHPILPPTLHHVTPVTGGVRLASFFWIQSMVRADADRTLLFELGTALQQFEQAVPEPPAVVTLTGVYYNLFRRWTDT